jgi:hypothetical protein
MKSSLKKTNRFKTPIRKDEVPPGHSSRIDTGCNYRLMSHSLSVDHTLMSDRFDFALGRGMD